jgi:hypothetical protein
VPRAANPQRAGDRQCEEAEEQDSKSHFSHLEFDAQSNEIDFWDPPRNLPALSLTLCIHLATLDKKRAMRTAPFRPESIPADPE